MTRALIWPDYENCIANIPNSILKKFGVETVGNTLPLADQFLQKDYKNIILLLLDGMGKCIIEKHLDEKGAFRTHLAGITNSVFLSTTVAATTSAISGLQPCEHSWLGWDCYYPQINKNVTVFRNTVQDTEEPAADFNVPWVFTPYENVVEKINKAGGNAYMCVPFFEPYPNSFEQICENVSAICSLPEQKYIYAYWTQPDELLHRNGSDSTIVHDTLLDLERTVGKLVSKLEDTLLIITADHGHIDNEYVVLQDYPKLCDCLIRMPSLEPRALNLFVKEDRKELFEAEFNKEFGDKFILMPMEEVIERKLFGTRKPHECFRGMLGNYLAIATSNLTIYYGKEKWISMHGSITAEEVQVPLIVFDSASCK